MAAPGREGCDLHFSISWNGRGVSLSRSSFAVRDGAADVAGNEIPGTANPAWICLLSLAQAFVLRGKREESQRGFAGLENQEKANSCLFVSENLALPVLESRLQCENRDLCFRGSRQKSNSLR